MSGAHVLLASDRESFKRCRRAWDFGSRGRQNLEPRAPRRGLDLDEAVREALAVYYFPGMWSWSRSIVEPLAFEAFAKSVREQRAAPGCVLPDTEEEWKAAAARGETLLARYFAWAPGVDQFSPIRVKTEFQVGIPDPDRAGDDLLAPDGQPILYRGRIDLLIENRQGAHWIVKHLPNAVSWRDRDELALDEQGLADCWAWELYFLGMTIAGVLYNELGAEGFRRRPVERPREALEASRRQLAREALEMTDPEVLVSPSPAWGSCSVCAYRPPCIAMYEGADPVPLLEAGYRRRPEEPVREGLLGKTTWSVGRGARPLRFGGGGRA